MQPANSKNQLTTRPCARHCTHGAVHVRARATARRQARVAELRHGYTSLASDSSIWADGPKALMRRGQLEQLAAEVAVAAAEADGGGGHVLQADAWHEGARVRCGTMTFGQIWRRGARCS